MGPELQPIKCGGAQAVHFRAGHKRTFIREARGPRGIHGAKLGPDVEQDEEVDAAPGAQEGQDGGRRGECGVGGVGVEERETAVKESLLSGSGAAEGRQEGQRRSFLCVLRGGTTGMLKTSIQRRFGHILADNSPEELPCHSPRAMNPCRRPVGTIMSGWHRLLKLKQSWRERRVTCVSAPSLPYRMAGDPGRVIINTRSSFFKSRGT